MDFNPDATEEEMKAFLEQWERDQRIFKVISSNNVEELKELLIFIKDKKEKDDIDQRLFDAMVSNDSYNLLNYVLDNQIIKIDKKKKDICIVYAAKHGFLETVKVLYTHGADIDSVVPYANDAIKKYRNSMLLEKKLAESLEHREANKARLKL